MFYQKIKIIHSKNQSQFRKIDIKSRLPEYHEAEHQENLKDHRNHPELVTRGRPFSHVVSLTLWVPRLPY